MEAAIGSLLGAGWASGVNLYATVLLFGLFGRLGIAETPEMLQDPVVMGVAGVMYLLEFVADKIPYVDSLWDTVHTVIRPVGAALLGAQLAGDVNLSEVMGGGVSGVTALGSHLAKAGTRMAINTSPEPITNIGVSLVEDVAVGGMVWFAVTYPVAAGIIAVILLVLGGILLVLAWRLIRAGRKRFRTWRARRTAAGHLR